MTTYPKSPVPVRPALDYWNKLEQLLDLGKR